MTQTPPLRPSSARIECSREQAELHVCTVTGDLDAAAAVDLRRALRQLENSTTSARVVVDLSEASGIDPAAILVLITTADLARRTNRWFGLIANDGEIRRAINESGLGRHAPVYGSMAGALCVLSGTPLR